MKISTTSKATFCRPVTRRFAAAAFTLIEIMVVMVLLSVIVLGLMAMFNQTQRAFRAGMAQTDQLEGGRMLTDLLARDLAQLTPTFETNGVNFFAEIPANYSPAEVALPANSYPRTNILQDMFFMARQNQTWSGIGYYVRTNPAYFGIPNAVGTLYRFETNMHVAQLVGNGYLPFLSYQNATLNFQNATNISRISKVLDGVVEFRVRCFDNNGLMITNGSPSLATNQFVNITNSLTLAPGEVEFYAFSNNVAPAFVELEVGVLEPSVLKRLKSIPNATVRSNFLASHAGNIQMFRQRIAIRNVDTSVYSQP